MGEIKNLNGDKPKEMKVPKVINNPMRFETQVGKAYTKVNIKEVEAERGGKVIKYAIKSIQVERVTVDWACALELAQFGIKSVGIMPIRVILEGRISAWVTVGNEPPVYEAERMIIPFDCNNHKLEVDSKKFNPLSEAIAPKGVDINQFNNGDCKILITF